MKLTKEQEAMGLPQAWWDNQEACRRDIEYSREHPLSSEELQEQIKNNKESLRIHASLKEYKGEWWTTEKSYINDIK